MINGHTTIGMPTPDPATQQLQQQLQMQKQQLLIQQQILRQQLKVVSQQILLTQLLREPASQRTQLLNRSNKIK